MAQPQHGYWCNSRTYKTKCRECGQQVYYFSCDCGSKVFFDSLGDWQVHDCAQSVLAIVNVGIDLSFKYRVAERERRRREKTWQPGPIQRVSPSAANGSPVAIAGHAREVVSISAAKLGIPTGNPMAIAMYGDLAKEKLVQVTLHADGLETDAIKSYTFVLTQKAWDKIRAIKGDLVFAKLTATTAGENIVWVAEHVDRLN